MARLCWNFAPRRGWTQPCSIVCVLALTGCVHALWWRHDLLQQRDYVVGQAQKAFGRAAARDHRVSSPPPVALNQVFAEMRYPWTDVLDSLKRVATPGLDLLTLEPDAGAIRRVHISGVANQAQDVFDLIAALQGDHAWSSVQLISQTRTDDTAMPRANGSAFPGLPTAFPRSISFSLVAEWGQP
ncbi:PilN domain-containing protein [Paraburkholderia fungorum]|jgi:Fimbrial assembly protein (PilN)|uniref:PilN domain-containing protein n=1 Tax=Paraburkholderia fungorum TaxID=134537 RepID=UPI0038B903F6